MTVSLIVVMTVSLLLLIVEFKLSFNYLPELEQRLSRDVSALIECAENAIRTNKFAVEACELHNCCLKQAMDADNGRVGVLDPSFIMKCSVFICTFTFCWRIA